MAFKIAEGYVELKEKGLIAINNAIAKTKGLFLGATSAMGGFSSGLVASLGTVAFAMKSIGAYEEQYVSEAKLGAVLRATGREADLSKEKLIAYANSMQMVTNFQDDQIINAQALLATFKRVRSEGFERTMNAAMDLAAVFGGDLQSTVVQLGKALENPTEGLSALRRAGVTFTDAEKEKIKVLQESNRLLEAQGVILSAIEGQVEGAAKATVSNLNKIKKVLGEALEMAGGAVVGAVSATGQLLGTEDSGIAGAVRAKIAENQARDRERARLADAQAEHQRRMAAPGGGGGAFGGVGNAMIAQALAELGERGANALRDGFREHVAGPLAHELGGVFQDLKHAREVREAVFAEDEANLRKSQLADEFHRDRWKRREEEPKHFAFRGIEQLARDIQTAQTGKSGLERLAQQQLDALLKIDEDIKKLDQAAAFAPGAV